MSHFTSLSKVDVTDKQAFIKAAKELGFDVVETKTMNGYQGNTMKAEVVVRKPGCKYDIGLVNKGPGKYEIISDWWGVNQSVRNADKRISQLTTKNTITRKYAKLGFMADVKQKGDELVLTLTR